MKTIHVPLILLFLVSFNLSAQNLIGYNEQEIRKYMTDNEKSLTYQSFINNSTFKYLKYADSEGTTTLLFFLNEQMVCKSVRLIIDKSLKAQKIKEYNSLYKKAGDNQWTEAKNDKIYLIIMKDEEWSLNITITLKE
jgi:hypothetical protein